MIKVVVPANQDGQRLDKFLSSQPELASREIAGKLIREGKVFVGNETGTLRLSRPVIVGEVIRFELIDEEINDIFQPEKYPLEIHFEDENFIVLYKPKGILSHPSGNQETGSLANFLAGRGNVSSGFEINRPGIVHRLDKDTSGLMITTKTDKAQAAFARMFRESEIRKKYLALVEGVPRSLFGAIKSPIGDHPRDPRKKIIHPEGRPSETKWKKLAFTEKNSLLVCEPKTGRTHQIRVHLLSFKCPIYNDPLYKLSRPQKPLVSASTGHFLHACSLAFNHPFTGERLAFFRRPPKKFQLLTTRLGINFNFIPSHEIACN